MCPWVPPGRGSATSPGTGLKKQHQPEHSGHRGQVVGLACGNVCTDSIEGPGTAEHVGGDEGGAGRGHMEPVGLQAASYVPGVQQWRWQRLSAQPYCASKCHPASGMGHP